MTVTRRLNLPGRRQMHILGLALPAVLITGLLLGGCGGASKPAYCNPVNKMESSVKNLPSLSDIRQNGVGALKSAVSALEKNVTSAVNQAKQDFSSQTKALKTAVSNLSASVKQLGGSPSAATLAQVATNVSAVGTAAKNLQSAVAAKCG